MNIIKNKSYYKNNIISLLINKIYFYETFYDFFKKIMIDYSYLTHGGEAKIFYSKKNKNVIKVYNLFINFKSLKSILNGFNYLKQYINMKIQLHNNFIQYFNKFCDINCQTELYAIVITYNNIYLLTKQQYYEKHYENYLSFIKIRHLLISKGITLYKSYKICYYTYISNIFNMHNKKILVN